MKIVVFGSAHLDILSEATTGKDTIDRPGDLRIHVGGTAFNLAVNLSNLGAEVSFCSAFNGSSISKMIMQELRANGVQVNAVMDERLPDSGFSAHIQDAEIYSAVSSIAVERHTFSDSYIREQIEGSSWVCLESNLSSQTLTRVIDTAHALSIPVSLQLVSETKGLKLSQIPSPDMVIGNLREHQYLLAKAEDWEPAEGLVMYVTNGSKKALAYQGSALQATLPPESISNILNTLGAGDAFAAGAIVKRLEVGPSDHLAIMKAGHELAASVLGQINCNPGQQDVLNRTLKELDDKAYHDQLTGLLNRQAEDQIYKGLEKSKEPFGIIYLDIDHFKLVNDTYGHDVGDQVLISVGELIKTCVRDSDHVIRHGGEEFIVVLPTAGENKACEIAERIVQAVRTAPPPEPITHLTLSAGVACGRRGEQPRRVAEFADKALYSAKRGGRNRVKFLEEETVGS